MISAGVGACVGVASGPIEVPFFVLFLKHHYKGLAE